MLRIYLDQNKWIDIGRAFLGRPAGERFQDVLALAGRGIELGLVSFPLSAIHYTETYSHRKAQRRGELAAAMATVSRFHTIAPQSKILRWELDLALQRRFGRPGEVRTCQVFGTGLAHAFGLPAFDPRTRIPGATEAQLAMWEYLALAGPPADFPLAWMDTEGFKKPSQDFLQIEARLRATFKTEGLSSSRRRDFIAFGEVVDILDQLNEALERAQVSADALAPDGAKSLTAFLEDLPTRNVAYQLRAHRHDNPEHPLGRTDLDDIGALAVAIPYCDVVVTEKSWTDLAKRARLDERYGTIIVADLNDLVPVLLSHAA